MWGGLTQGKTLQRTANLNDFAVFDMLVQMNSQFIIYNL